MIRGAQKKMIVLRTHNSRMFEEAYFVMRQNAEPTDSRGNDMLWEANRILEGSLSGCLPERQAKAKRKHRLQALLLFLGGVLCGSGGVGLLWWLL